MALSGSTDFNLTAEKVIRRALVKLKKVGTDAPVVLRALQDTAMEELNLVLKQLSTVCPIHLWKLTELKVVLVENRNRYEFGADADKVYRRKARTHSIASAISGATTIDVDGSTSDYATADTSIDIHLSDGSVHTTTMSAVASTSGGATLTLVTALDAAMDSGAQIETYVLETRVPLRITEAYRVEDPDGTAPSVAPITLFARKDLFELGNRRTDGNVYAAYYERQLNSAGSPVGFLHIASESDTTDRELRVFAQIPVDDVDNITDNVDIKPEHLNALVYMLADQLLDSFEDIDEMTLLRIPARANALWQSLIASDDEQDASVFFAPDNYETRY